MRYSTLKNTEIETLKAKMQSLAEELDRLTEADEDEEEIKSEEEVKVEDEVPAEEEVEVKEEEVEEIPEEDKLPAEDEELIKNVLRGVLTSYMDSVEDMRVLFENASFDEPTKGVLEEIREEANKMVGRVQAVLSIDNEDSKVSEEARKETEEKLEGGDTEVKEEETVETIKPLEDEAEAEVEVETEEEAKEKTEESLNEELQIIVGINDFQPWSGAVETYNRIVDAVGIDRVESVLEEMFPDGARDVDINDLFWHEDDDYLNELFGVEDEDEEETITFTFEEVDDEGDPRFIDSDNNYHWVEQDTWASKDMDAIKQELADSYGCDVDQVEVEGVDFAESVSNKKCHKIIKEKKMTEAPDYDLRPEYDSRKSFYNKARVNTDDPSGEKLFSYNTLVAEMKDGKPVVYGTYSATTLRHIKEWLKQHGFKADNGKQIMKDYGKDMEESCKTRESRATEIRRDKDKMDRLRGQIRRDKYKYVDDDDYIGGDEERSIMTGRNDSRRIDKDKERLRKLRKEIRNDKYKYQDEEDYRNGDISRQFDDDIGDDEI